MEVVGCSNSLAKTVNGVMDSNADPEIRTRSNEYWKGMSFEGATVSSKARRRYSLYFQCLFPMGKLATRNLNVAIEPQGQSYFIGRYTFCTTVGMNTRPQILTVFSYVHNVHNMTDLVEPATLFNIFFSKEQVYKVLFFPKFG